MSKKCKGCQEVKDESQFYKAPSNKDGLFSKCKTCISLESKERYADNPDLLKQRASVYRRDNPDKIKALKQKDYKNELERRKLKRKKARAARVKKVRVQPTWSERQKRMMDLNPDYRNKRNEQAKRWRIDNPAQVSFSSHRRRVLKSQAPGKFSFDEWKRLCDEFGNKCLACGKEELTIDHIAPLSKGGTNYLSNVQPLCGSCNSIKHDKTIDYRPFIPEWVTI